MRRVSSAAASFCRACRKLSRGIFCAGNLRITQERGWEDFSVKQTRESCKIGPRSSSLLCNRWRDFWLHVTDSEDARPATRGASVEQWAEKMGRAGRSAGCPYECRIRSAQPSSDARCVRFAREKEKGHLTGACVFLLFPLRFAGHPIEGGYIASLRIYSSSSLTVGQNLTFWF